MLDFRLGQTWGLVADRSVITTLVSRSKPTTIEPPGNSWQPQGAGEDGFQAEQLWGAAIAYRAAARIAARACPACKATTGKIAVPTLY